MAMSRLLVRGQSLAWARFPGDPEEARGRRVCSGASVSW